MSNLMAQTELLNVDVDKTNFPSVNVKFNLSNPEVLESDAFEFIENGESIDFSLVHLPVREDTTAPIQVLILVEDLFRSNRNSFYKSVLLESLPQIVNSGDRFNIATFNRNRADKNIFPLLDDYTDDLSTLIKAVKDIKTDENIFTKNKSSDLYHAIYDGLNQLNSTSGKNKFLFVLSSGFNNDKSSHDSFLPSKQYGVEHKIPVYSIQYFIKGGEMHKVPALCKETYGDYIITKKWREGADAMMRFANESFRKGLGQNYRLSYTSNLAQDGEIYTPNIEVKGKNYSFNFHAPDKPFWSKMWDEYFQYTLLAILAALTILGITIGLFFNTRQVSISNSNKIASELEMVKARNSETSNIINRQSNELNRLKLENQKRIQQVEIKNIEKKLLSEMNGSGKVAYLHYNQAGTFKKFKINRPLIRIGRSQDNNLILSNSTVSRNHAEIYFSNGKYFINDRNSTSGIVVNGIKTSGKPLLHNDSIELGKVVLTFVH